MEECNDDVRRLAAAFQLGQAVEWKFESRKGYGYSWWVPATVVKVCRKKITIDALRMDGTTKRISVTPDRLRHRKQI